MSPKILSNSLPEQLDVPSSYKRPKNRSKATRAKAAAARASHQNQNSCCNDNNRHYQTEATTPTRLTGDGSAESTKAKDHRIVLSFVPDEYGGISPFDAVNILLFTPKATMHEDIIVRVHRSRYFEFIMLLREVRSLMTPRERMDVDI